MSFALGHSGSGSSSDSNNGKGSSKDHSSSANGTGQGMGSSSGGSASYGKGLEGQTPLPVIDPVVLDERGRPLQEYNQTSSSVSRSSGRSSRSDRSGGTARGAGEAVEGAAALDSPAARWTALLQLPPAVWGLSWLLTMGPVSVTYSCLAAAAAIAATAFSGLAPGPVAASAAGATAAAAGAAGSAGSAGASAAAAAAAVASVDWLDVALRTANGLAAGGAARAQVLQTLQEAGAGSLESWAVQTLLPALCGAASAARGVAVALQPVDPLLGALTQLGSVAAGLCVLLVMGLPLRPYLAPLLPALPRGRPSAATMAAVRAGGVACMVAVLTGLQAAEVTTPELGRSVRSAAAAAAAGAPLLAQAQACLYGVFAVAADVAVPAATAMVAARAAGALRRCGGGGCSSSPQGATGSVHGVEGESRGKKGEEAEAADSERLLLPGELVGVRWLGAGRLAMDVLLLAAVAGGSLSAHLSAVRLLGMLWLFQTARQVAP
ncbi:hypothetical protein HYH02_012109 [Chlamydomonas schloesseri]|uniref:Uncharacterized protein n=1 Tax=Chlamydomonas schloesseri TaxID=2026947 RepID=A0A835T064_9CHLO|nr:hypothetical protein HYH02_012109 [Chlamydomonas schloesseri]|eukprot:KAG2434911.1 hypothetical protein HYH02_012109 [Chlamydomonas schloesseri]